MNGNWLENSSSLKYPVSLLGVSLNSAFCICSLFSNEQYFDDKGFFVSLTVSAPLLVNSLIILVSPDFLLSWTKNIVLNKDR